MDFRFYVSLFLRRLHWFLLFLFVGSAAGITLARVLPPTYVAQARLLVESEQIPGDLAASTVQTEATEQLEIIQQRILTRDTLVDMANRLEIYGSRGDARAGMDTDSLVEDMRDRISIVTTGGNQPRGPARATLVSVSFEAPTARLSASVTNELVTLILREDVGMRTRVARQTLEFFEQEVARLDGELSRLGASILAFKEDNQDALPDSLEFRRNQQAAYQERLLQLSREEAALSDRRNRMVRLHESLGGNADTTPVRDQTVEQRQLQTLRDDLAAQLAVLSPENPRVKLLQARIAALETIVADQVARGGGQAEDGQPINAFQVQLAEIDGQVDFVSDQRRQVEASLARLGASIEATPGNAITLDTLERDYANVRAQYDQAVSNMARAETGDVIEALSKGQRISIVEQAVVPAEPESPNRPLIAAGGVAGGAALGLAVVVLLTLLKSGIRRPADLTDGLGIAPFATLPYYRTRGEVWRRRTIIGGALGVALVGIPVGLWVVHTQVMPLDQLIDMVGRRVGLAGLSPAGGPVPG